MTRAVGRQRLMPTKAQLFHIGDVLSISSGRLVSRDGYDGLQRALSYMAGEEVYTHQVSCHG